MNDRRRGRHGARRRPATSAPAPPDEGPAHERSLVEADPGPRQRAPPPGRLDAGAARQVDDLEREGTSAWTICTGSSPRCRRDVRRISWRRIRSPRAPASAASSSSPRDAGSRRTGGERGRVHLLEQPGAPLREVAETGRRRRARCSREAGSYRPPNPGTAPAGEPWARRRRRRRRSRRRSGRGGVQRAGSPTAGRLKGEEVRPIPPPRASGPRPSALRPPPAFPPPNRPGRPGRGGSAVRSACRDRSAAGSGRSRIVAGGRTPQALGQVGEQLRLSGRGAVLQRRVGDQPPVAGDILPRHHRRLADVGVAASDCSTSPA